MNIPLRYGNNPYQRPARLIQPEEHPPLCILNGEPSYINILDALAGWQLVHELSWTTGKAAAASFKHLSPAGAAVAGPVSHNFVRSQFLTELPKDPVSQAYIRARGADRMSSFGDAVAVSETVTAELALILRAEVSDLIVAPSYEPEALEILRSKRRGAYLVLKIDPDYTPPEMETREVFGLRLEQIRNQSEITTDLFRAANFELPTGVLETLVVGTTALKYTQSNSVCVAFEGQVIGMAAGQQSRIHATRIACDKAEKWMLQTHPKVLGLHFPVELPRPERANLIDQYLLWERLSSAERGAFASSLGYAPEPLSTADRKTWFTKFSDLCLSSDAFIPFRDNIDRAARTGVRYVAHPGGAIREESVRAAAAEYGIVLLETGTRLFLH